MTGISAAEAAYRAYSDQIAIEYGAEPADGDWPRWEEVPQAGRAAWEAAAEAARSFGRRSGDDPVERLLALPLSPQESGSTTVRSYLAALLAVTWRDYYAGRKPGARTSHQDAVYAAIARAGFVAAATDDSSGAADALILAAIERLGAS
jgi:hypothetical protein